MRGKRCPSPQAAQCPGITPAHAGKTVSTPCGCKRRRDHPRACGENAFSVLCEVGNQGSPPRMRGKPDRYQAHGHGYGITPACAGKTRHRHRHSQPLRDHPRVCGENCWEKAQALADWGSPPRVRGKRGLDERDAARRMDHPRVCGENPRLSYGSFGEPGSPPRVRGKRRSA